MKTLILGCALFGKGQGSNHDVTVVTIDEVKVFKSESEASEYGEENLKNGGDSYFIYNPKKDIKWNKGTWELFNAMQVEALFRDTTLGLNDIAKNSKMHPIFIEMIEKAYNFKN